MLQRGDLVPLFKVRGVDGEPFSYSSIWQRQNPLLVSVPTPASDSARRYIADLTTRLRDLGAEHLEYVITRDSVPDVCAPAVLVADKWGEVVYIAETSDVADLPSPKELVEWANYLNNQCPECEGEAK